MGIGAYFISISSFFKNNKQVRKLEFLLAEALARGADCVVTCGGVQSNHCRATAAAARRVGLQPHVVSRACSAPL